MYDVNFWRDNEDHTERFSNEEDARKRYNELIGENSCAWVELIKLIDNWCYEID